MSVKHTFTEYLEVVASCGEGCEATYPTTERPCGRGLPLTNHIEALCIGVEIEMSFWTENYGADADGNRGTLTDMHEVEDWNLKPNSVQRYTDNGVAPNASLDTLSPVERTMATAAAELLVDAYEPDQDQLDPGDEEPPDRDR